MEPQDKISYEDEINLYDYWKVIVKRKSLIIGLFFIATLASAIISLLMPKIYRGEVVLQLTAKELTAKELLGVIGKIDGEKIKSILPKTHYLVTDVKLNALKDSTNKLNVVIDAKRANDIPDAVSELVEYMNNNQLIKRYVEQERERLLKQSEELFNIIEDSKELRKNYNRMLVAGRLVPIGFNPIDLDKKISDLKIEKVVVEQAIKNLKGMEIIEQYISNKPVKPKKRQMVAIAGVTSLFAGILLAFFVEYIEKVKLQNKNA
ncbi:MAG: Wzz/FepE/Etk N-terminal domain-containing protein [Nitrospiraceae bacterium]|jgi:hypothetical protein|nr:Wzz/FepE/Etk N-terminal domain-containing protein [Nitrospiraceae bacterium]